MTVFPENVNDSKGRHSPVMTTTPLESFGLCSYRVVEKPRGAALRGPHVASKGE